ncbi:hypothetical protein KAX97_04350 [candidate division WOR-3 bacterium]|nr:hypothetical protein [candidate division WOR-3 bacterium]
MTLLLLFLHVQTINIFSQENIIKFANHLYAQEDYAAALNEYRRYQFLTDSMHEDIPEIIIDCLVKLKRFDQAIKESTELKNNTKRDFIKGWIFFLAGKYDSSRIYLKRVGLPYKEDVEKIMGLGYAYEFRFHQAGEYIELPDKAPKYKKPVLGAIYALFPGGGHFYCGRIGDGIFSFLVISTSALLSHYYYNRKEDIKFSVSLGAAILFYAANIYGGINAVQNYNYYQDEHYLQRILEHAE